MVSLAKLTRGMSVKFNDTELNTILRVVEGFTPYDGADFSPVTSDRPQHTGADFVYTKIGSKVIEMPFAIQDDLANKYDDIMRIINVREPKPLVFGALPNRIFMAIPEGRFDFEEGVFMGTGSILWHIPSGIGRSASVDPITFTKTSDGVLEAKLVNNGTEWATVDYDITMNYENGYIGVISEYGGIELGKIEEADAEQAYRAETITTNMGGNFANWTNATKYYENPGKGIVTTMGYDGVEGGRLGTLPGTFTNTTNTTWFGACKEYVWTDTATDWYIWARAWFEAGLPGQTGQWALCMVDEAGIFIAGMIIEKTDKTGNRAGVGFVVGDGKGGSKVIKWIYFTASGLVTQNPYGIQGLRAGRNCFDIKKEGNKLTFFWYGQYFSYVVPEIAALKMKRIQFYNGQVHGRNTSTQLVTRMYVNDVKVFKNNSPYMKDIINRFSKDSVVHIDGDEEKSYFNNMVRLGDEIVGSNYFMIPPGETDVQIVYSSWSNPEPTATATVNEVYI